MPRSIRGRRVGFAVFATLTIASLAACAGANAPSIEPPSQVGSTQAPSADEVELWTAFRRAYGLRADHAWLLHVAADPSVSIELEVPLLPWEIDRVAAMNRDTQAFVSTVRRYGENFPDAFAGAYLQGPQVVVAFADQVDQRRVDIEDLFAGATQIDVRSVKYSLLELTAKADEVNERTSWFDDLGAVLVGVDVNEPANAVDVRYRSRADDLAPIISARFGHPDWLRLQREGPIGWTGPRGDLEVRVVDPDGNAVPIECLLRPGSDQVRGEHLPLSAPDGICSDTELPAVTWYVDLTYPVDGTEQTKTIEIVVPAGGVGRAVVVASP